MLQFVLVALQRILAMLKLAAADDVDGVFDGGKLILYQNVISPAVDVLLADLNENDFTGYARSSAVTWGSIYNSGSTGVPYMPGDLKTFSCTGGSDQNVAGYAYISADVTPVLLGYRNFENTITITSGQSISIIPRIGLSDGGPIPDVDPQLS